MEKVFVKNELAKKEHHNHEHKNGHEVETELVKITPKRNHIIKQNLFFYDLKAGVEIQVAKRFIAALKTEKVID